MKGYFLVDAIPKAERLSGVEQKILWQIEALSLAGLCCEPLALDPAPPTNRKTDALLRRLPYGNAYPRWVDHPQLLGADFLYFRKPSYLSQPMRRVLGHFKRHKPQAPVFMEIPSYPYENEYGPFWQDGIFKLKDRFNRARLKGLIDRIVYIADTDHDELFGIPAIRIINGTPFSQIALRKPRANAEIDLLAVAKFAKWHGYERLLEGMKAYYAGGGQREIRLHMAGEGDELPRYQTLAKDPSLNKRVLFYGHQNGRALDELYDLADLGVTSLGAYKDGIQLGSFLKSREYLAKGLPMVTGCPIDVLNEEARPFFCEFPNDDSPIDMARLIAFYDSIGESEADIVRMARKIRAFGEQTVDILATMSPVAEAFKSLL